MCVSQSLLRVSQRVCECLTESVRFSQSLCLFVSHRESARVTQTLRDSHRVQKRRVFTQKETCVHIHVSFGLWESRRVCVTLTDSRHTRSKSSLKSWKEVPEISSLGVVYVNTGLFLCEYTSLLVWIYVSFCLFFESLNSLFVCVSTTLLKSTCLETHKNFSQVLERSLSFCVSPSSSVLKFLKSQRLRVCLNLKHRSSWRRSWRHDFRRRVSPPPLFLSLSLSWRRFWRHDFRRRVSPRTLIERTSPPRGVFLFTMFPHQEPCVRGPPSKNLVQILRGGSSYTRFLMREHSKQETPPGGGISFDQLGDTYISFTIIRLQKTCVSKKIFCSLWDVNTKSFEVSEVSACVSQCLCVSKPVCFGVFSSLQSLRLRKTLRLQIWKDVRFEKTSGVLNLWDFKRL